VLAEVATTLAHVLSRGGSRVGAIVMDTGVDLVIPPASGRTQVLRIAQTLLDRREARAAEVGPGAAAGSDSRGSRGLRGSPGWFGRRRARAAAGRGGQDTAFRRRPPAPASGGMTDLSVLLAAAAGIARRRSLVLVVSDFITTDGWEAPLARLGQRHEVVAIQVVDPRESELPDAGGVYVEDAETGEQIFVDTSDVAFRARLAAVAAARQADLEARARKAGVDLYPVRTDDDLVRSLLRISELRRRRRR
jgi:uncharacterized protein (DUF58 family)